MDRIDINQAYTLADLVDICRLVQIRAQEAKAGQDDWCDLTEMDVIQLVNEVVAARESYNCRVLGLNPAAPAPKRRGRKPGSRNKPKTTAGGGQDMFAIDDPEDRGQDPNAMLAAEAAGEE